MIGGYKVVSAEAVRGLLGDRALEVSEAYGETTVVVAREAIVEVLRELRDGADMRLVQLIDLAGVDWPERRERFDVTYHLMSPFKNHRLRVKVRAGDGDAVPSVTSVFPNADWYERECFDMYGVPFTGHPDMRRILTDYGFSGYPLRKDFPMTGYVEVRYDEELRRVVYEPVKLPQEFRSFDFLSPWEGADYTLPGDEKTAAPAEAPKP